MHIRSKRRAGIRPVGHHNGHLPLAAVERSEDVDLRLAEVVHIGWLTVNLNADIVELGGHSRLGELRRIAPGHPAWPDARRSESCSFDFDPLILRDIWKATCRIDRSDCWSRIEDDVQHWVQLDSVRCYTILAVQKVEEPNASDLYRNASGVEIGAGFEMGIEFRAGIGDTRSERTARAYAVWAWNLGNHGLSGRVREDKVVVGIIFELVLGQSGVQHKQRCFGWLHAVVLRFVRGCGQGR